VLLNFGDGTYAPDVRYDVPGCFALSIGDLDGDNDADLAVAAYFGNSVSILLNNGDGTFAPAGQHDVGVNPRFVSIGDVDGDNNLDLAVANNSSDDVSILLNRCRDILPGDCDGNGSVDLLDYQAFAGCVTGPDPKGPLPDECRCHDLDHDADVDLHDFALFQVVFGQ
jgi:hypothetical protein